MSINSVRVSGNFANWHVLIDTPPVVYSGRATGSVDAATRAVGYNQASGTLASVLPDQTLLVGTSAGAWDKGATRLRKAPSASLFYLGANPIQIANGDYLTVVDSFLPWGRHFVGSLLDAEEAYSDQNSTPKPVPVLTPGAVIKAGETVTFDAAGSWCPGATITGAAWTFPGGSNLVTNGLAATITYANAGRYRVTCVVTASNGKTNTAYRYVWVGQTPLADVQIDEVQCDRSGYSCKLTVLETPAIRYLAQAIVYSDDYYNGSAASYGYLASRPNIVMMGWVSDRSVKQRRRTKTTEIQISGLGAHLQDVAASPLGLQDSRLPQEGGQVKAPPSPWAIVTGLTAQKALQHLLETRSTLARMTDVTISDPGAAVPNYALTDSLARQLDGLASRTALGCVADRYGRIMLARDPQDVPVADRGSIPVIYDAVDADWQGDLDISYRVRPEAATGQVEGYFYDAATGKTVQMGAISPDHQPAAWGGSVQAADVAFTGQAEANALAGLRTGALATAVERVVGVMQYNMRLLDVAPGMFIRVTTPDGVQEKYIPRRIIYRRNADTGHAYTILDLEPQGLQWPAVALTYPENGEPPPGEEGGGGDPPDPPIDPPGEEEPPPAGSAAVAIAATTADIRTTANFGAASPTWVTEL